MFHKRIVYKVHSILKTHSPMDIDDQYFMAKLVRQDGCIAYVKLTLLEAHNIKIGDKLECIEYANTVEIKHVK